MIHRIWHDGWYWHYRGKWKIAVRLKYNFGMSGVLNRLRWFKFKLNLFGGIFLTLSKWLVLMFLPSPTPHPPKYKKTTKKLNRNLLCCKWLRGKSSLSGKLAGSLIATWYYIIHVKWNRSSFNESIERINNVMKKDDLW